MKYQKRLTEGLIALSLFYSYKMCLIEDYLIQIIAFLNLVYAGINSPPKADYPFYPWLEIVL